MPRTMSPEREQEFQELSAYLMFYATCVMGLDPASPHHPVNTLASIVEEIGRSKALDGLRQATNDTIEDTARLSAAELAELDGKCESAGVVTISEIRRRYSASFRRIVKRGSIRNDTEYYLVNAIVVDLTSDVSDEERQTLQALLDRYEARV